MWKSIDGFEHQSKPEMTRRNVLVRETEVMLESFLGPKPEPGTTIIHSPKLVEQVRRTLLRLFAEFGLGVKPDLVTQNSSLVEKLRLFIKACPTAANAWNRMGLIDETGIEFPSASAKAKRLGLDVSSRSTAPDGLRYLHRVRGIWQFRLRGAQPHSFPDSGFGGDFRASLAAAKAHRDTLVESAPRASADPMRYIGKLAGRSGRPVYDGYVVYYRRGKQRLTKSFSTLSYKDPLAAAKAFRDQVHGFAK